MQKLLANFLPGVEVEDIIPKEFFCQLQEINPEIIIIPFSGGIDSTVITLLMHENNYDCILLFNHTHRVMKTAINTINKIQKFTEFPLIVTHPRLNQKEINEKTKARIDVLLPKYISGEKTLVYLKHDIPCCRYLKEYPAQDFYENYVDLEKTVILSGIAPYEGNQRDAWSRIIKRRGTYFHPHKTKNGLMFGYPLRDLFNKDYAPVVLSEYLMAKGFDDTRRTGCRGSCPIVAIHYHIRGKRIEEDERRFQNSLKVWIPEKYRKTMLRCNK